MRSKLSSPTPLPQLRTALGITVLQLPLLVLPRRPHVRCGTAGAPGPHRLPAGTSCAACRPSLGSEMQPGRLWGGRADPTAWPSGWPWVPALGAACGMQGYVG